jgi:hypothetical protein
MGRTKLLGLRYDYLPGHRSVELLLYGGKGDCILPGYILHFKWVFFQIVKFGHLAQLISSGPAQSATNDL